MTLQAARVVDGRFMEPPQPFVATMEMLGTLQSGEEMQLLLYREPHPLYRVLQQNGHGWRTELQDDGTFVVTIRC